MPDSYTKILITNLALRMYIGVHPEEKTRRQTVIVNVELFVDRNPDWETDLLEHTVDYASIVDGIHEIKDGVYMQLAETFAEKIAVFCLQEPRVQKAIVRVQKADVFDEADAVGVEICRAR